MDALTLVFVNTSGRPMNFYGTVYGPGELIVGMEDERNVSSVMSAGSVVPVVLESLPSNVQSAYTSALEAYRKPAAPAPAPAAEDAGDEPAEPQRKAPAKKAPAS